MALPGEAHQIDQIEHYFGASHVSAQAGNGGLTVAVAPRGEITVLSWPSPSYNDQLDYETSNDEDARLLPFFGAEADQGIFSGLLLTTSSGTQFSWLRDGDWDVTQSYFTEESEAILTIYERADLGLVVKELLFVDPETDVLYRRASVRRAPTSPVATLRYVLYENLAPATDHAVDLALRPLSGFDDDNDFAAWYSSSDQAVIHFTPELASRDLALLDGLLNGIWALGDTWATLGEPELEGLLEGPWSTGAFLAIGGAEAPASYQVGWQDDRPCDRSDQWTWLPESAFADTLDGELTESPIAGCHANASLAWDHDFGAVGSEAEATFDVYLAAGSSVTTVREDLALARHEGFDSALQRREIATADRVASLLLPDHPGLGEEITHFARRTLLSLDQGTDRDSAAMVASVATQPPYHLDWPRDSAFFNLTLDVAGDFDQVSEHNLFLAGVQNREAVWGGSEDTPILASPPGAWLMNFWADGQPANIVLNPFEIDQVGLAVWGFWGHATFATNDEQRRDVLASVWPAMKRGADLLSTCVDDTHPAITGNEAAFGIPNWWTVYEDLLAGTLPDDEARTAALEAGNWEALRPCSANEDDNPIPSVSIYSTHTVRMGLLAAVRAAEVLCIDDPRVDYWRERADELATVAFKLYYSPGLVDEPGVWDERADWVLWPEPLTIAPDHDRYFSDATDPAVARAEVEAFNRTALDSLALTFHEEVGSTLSLESEGGAYENKKTLSLARYWTGDRVPEGDLVAENIEHIRILGADFPLTGTRHVGEVFSTVDSDGDGFGDSVDQRVAVPHLWAASLTYLSAMAVAHPERFEALEGGDFSPVCMGGDEPYIQREAPACDAGSCGQSFVGRAERATGGGLVVALILLVTLRRRRS